MGSGRPFLGKCYAVCYVRVCNGSISDKVLLLTHFGVCG